MHFKLSTPQRPVDFGTGVLLMQRSVTTLLFLQDRFCSGPALRDISHPGASSLQPCSHDPAK